MKDYKIFKIETSKNPAYIDIKNRMIFIDKKLDKFPLFKEAILRHEKSHLNDKGVWDCLKTDFKDYPNLLMNKEYEAFIKYYKENNPYILNAISQFTYIFLNSYIILYAHIVVFFKKIIGDDKNG